MIFTILGTQMFSFERLIDYLKEVKAVFPDEEVVVQYGHTKVESSEFKVYDFIDKETYSKLLDESSFVITHGGVGSIHDGLYRHKKIICLPRKKEFNEHIDDHQLEICKKYQDMGYVLCAENKDEFIECLNKIIDFEPREFEIPNNEITKYLIGYIENERK